MQSYPHALTEEQMLNILEMAGIKYKLINNPDVVENEIQIKADAMTYVKIVSELEPVVPHLFEFFVQLRNEGAI